VVLEVVELVHRQLTVELSGNGLASASTDCLRKLHVLLKVSDGTL
jgi:hypothetical protein